MRRNDGILLGIILGMVVAFVLLYAILALKETNAVIVTVDGEIYGEYSLDENQEIKINNTNVLIVQDGFAYVKEATCSEQICVNHKKISKNKEVIVCLPNKVMIEVTDDKPNTIDAIAK